MSKESSKVVSNPYAKKKNLTGVSTSAPAPTVVVPTVVVPTAASTESFSGATFSQAFSSIEDTTHYQAEVQHTPLADSLGRAEQRDFDTKAARDEATRLDARDHHALLQPHVLYVSTKQRGNGVLKYIRNVPFAYSKMVPDYIMSSQRCALFLSIKYHALYPNYIHRRIAELKTDFKLRILLVFVDVEDNANVLLALNRLAVVQNLTLLLAWTEEEAARYLETFKAFDGKDASSIQKREQTNFVDQAADFLCTVRSVNKTDSAQLLSQFSSIKQIMAAAEDELSLCPGLGEKKVKRLWDALHKPFSSKRARERKEKLSAEEDGSMDEAEQKDPQPKGTSDHKDGAVDEKKVVE